MVTISSRPRLLRQISSAKRRMVGQYRVAQQRKFLAERKSLQLKQFRTKQKLELFKRRRNISQQVQFMRKAKQVKRANQISRARKTLKGFGIKW